MFPTDLVAPKRHPKIPKKGTFEDDLSFPKVGYISFLEVGLMYDSWFALNWHFCNANTPFEHIIFGDQQDLDRQMELDRSSEW